VTTNPKGGPDASDAVDTTFRLDSGDDASDGSFEVVLVSDGLVSTTRLPDRSPIVVGRGHDSDLRVANPSLSRRHLAIHQVDGALEVEDLGSSNGTKIGGVKLPRAERRRLHEGEILELGEVLMMPRPARVESEAPPAPDRPDRIIGVSMRPIYELVARIARGNISVLLRGATGVGKEVVARALHDASPRADKPFVTLNCAAVPEALLESELFGHERGAFTGAATTKVGLLETADGGTLLLDEIGELPFAMQAKLLRVLEDRRVLRVGGTRDREIDVRFLAATHRDLEADAAAGRFRSDLLYRLNGITVHIPPLRDRVDEIAPLAQAFIARARTQIGYPGQGSISAGAIVALGAYTWPGNVRELRNAMERAVLLSGGAIIERGHLPESVRGRRTTLVSGPSSRSQVSTTASTIPPPPPGTPPEGSGDLKSAVEEVERERIVAALEEAAGNQTRAAKLLGISRRALVRKLEAYKLPRPRKRVDPPGGRG